MAVSFHSIMTVSIYINSLFTLPRTRNKSDRLWYDKAMISKLIAYSPNNRQEAIDTLKTALDQYVINGVEHNIPFISDVLRNDEFVAGRTPTNFIDLHYPDGFSGVALRQEEFSELAAVVTVLSALNRNILDLPPLPMDTSDDHDRVVVSFGGMFGDHFIVKVHNVDENVLEVTSLPKSDETSNEISASSTELVSIDIDEYIHNDPIVSFRANGYKKFIQVRR